VNVLSISWTRKTAKKLAWKILNVLSVFQAGIWQILYPFPCSVFAVYLPGTPPFAPSESHRVFVDIEVFMKNVLHVPDNWKELWGPIIDGIKSHPKFLMAYLDYSHQCDIEGLEERFYGPLVDMTNAILTCCNSSLDHCVWPRICQHYFRNDLKRVLLGAMTDLYPQGWEKRHIKQTNLSWAHPLRVLEVKPSGGALVDGSFMPRLEVNGKPVDVSRDVVLSLTRNRMRSTGGPHSSLQAEEGNSPGCRPVYPRQGRLSAGTWGIPEAVCR